VPSAKFLGDVRQMPFGDQRFERVFIRNAIHDLDKASQIYAYSEIHRVLKNGGMFVLIAYHTTKETQYYYNKLVNFKDELAGNKNDSERYFPTKQEYISLFQRAGFSEIKNNFNFVGRLAYQNTTELNNEAGEKWKSFVLSMPPEIRAAMNIKIKRGILEYEFPCAIFTARKKEKR